MIDDERARLLDELTALERQSEQVQRELQHFRERLLRYESEVREEIVAAPSPPPPTEEIVEVVVARPVAPASRPSEESAGKDEERETSGLDLEFLLGGRGLLLIGVAALVLAVGFFVKEAIERGWLGPTVRVVLGGGVGVIAAIAGERVRALGYRTYGLWLAAGGFSAIYLSMWAAAALYGLVSAPLGFLLMVLVVAAAAVLGLLRESESFVALAALGGYLAPLLLHVETESNLFGLGYLGALSAAGLWVAYRGNWPYLAGLAVAGGMILPVANSGDPHLHGVYVTGLVAGALMVCHHRRWHYLGLLAVALGWICFAVGSASWGITGASFVAYAAAVTIAGLWISYRSEWPYLSSLAVAGGVLLPMADPGHPHLHALYLTVLIAVALVAARRRHWHIVSLLAVALGWFSFWLGSEGWGITGTAFAAYAAAIWLTNLIAWVGVRDWVLQANEAEPERAELVSDTPRLRAENDLREGTGLALTLLPSWVFLAAAMVGLQDSAYQDWRGEIGFALAAVLGTFTVGQALLSRPGIGAGSRVWRVVLGCAFWLAAPAILWENVALVRAWLMEGAVLVAAGVRLRNTVARTSALAAFTLAVLSYWSWGYVRPEADPAFVSGWALTGLAACLGLAAWSVAGWRVLRPASWEVEVRPFLLLASAVFFLGWGTAEILRFYELLGEAVRWTLARDLTISSFWMVYAAVLLSVGFWLKKPPARWAGLGMALLAAGKVFLYDLSQLSQLYRIGSFVLLAIVLLALSFRYQRWRRGLPA